MKINAVLVVLAVILALLLAFETGYLLRVKGTGANAAPLKKRNAVAERQRSPFVWKTRAGVQSPSAADAANRGEWDPFAEMTEIRREMNHLFQDSFGRASELGGPGEGALHESAGFNPDVDMQETKTDYIVKLDLPGIEKDKINIKADGNYLVISGEREQETPGAAGNDSRFYRFERSFGAFSRTIPLPPDAKTDGISAEAKDGVVSIRIPKIAAGVPNRPVDVKVK